MINRKLPLLLVGAVGFLLASSVLPAQGLQTAALMKLDNTTATRLSASPPITDARIPWTVANYVWNDENGNGVMDEEPLTGLADIPVRLLDPVSGSVVAETATDINGQYTFAGVEPDDYTVDVSDDVVALMYGLQRTTADFFGIKDNGRPSPPQSVGFGFDNQAGVVDGTLWWDRNTNGVRDWSDLPGLLPGSDGLAFVTVRAVEKETGEIIRETITDSYGYYLLDRLEPGSYTVEIDRMDPDLFRQTGTFGAGNSDYRNLLRQIARPSTPLKLEFNIPQECDQLDFAPEACQAKFHVGFASAEPASVYMSDLKAEADDRTIKLLWETGMEWDNERFEILHSYNYDEFAPVGSVAGAVSASEARQYSYVANDLRYGIHRYRLRQVSRHGSTAQTPNIEVHLSMDGAFVLDASAPDHYRDQNTVTFAVREAQRVTVELHSDLGGPPRVIFEEDLEANEVKELPIDASNITNGRYYVRMKGEHFEGARTVLLRR